MSWGEVFQAKAEWYAGENGRLLEELIDNHYAATMPRSQDDYVGLEQLGEIGDQVGVERRDISRIFGVLMDRPRECLDPTNKRGGPKKLIDLSTMGLVICERATVGFPDCPPEVISYDRIKPPKDRIVQAAGLIAVTPQLIKMDVYDAGWASMEALEAVSLELAKLPPQMELEPNAAQLSDN